MFKIIPCYVVFKREYAIIAYLTPERQKMENQRLSQSIKSSGKGFFKGSAEMMRYWSNYYKKYYSMGTDAIMAEDTANRLLYHNNLTEVYFSCQKEGTYDEGSYSGGSPGKLHFTLRNGEKIKLTHKESNKKANKEILASLYGVILKYRR
ncbi:MAG: hypothetical protein PHG48_06645 [Eubacteriales bacterium]|nr:hypothetical protein [Eubacteriales bacterium]